VTVEDRAFLSIGEVLSLLKEEFPDVTISKIRFLESQGLLDPERTPSGYRKFYDTDVERLRWILRQQREHFLPLKVIKGRLRTTAGHAVDDDGEMESVDLGAAPRAAPGAAPRAAPAQAAGPAARAASTQAPIPPPAVSAMATPPPPPMEAAPLTIPRTGASMTLLELAGASGLGEDELSELERFGLLVPRRVGSNVYYDEDALLVANLAAGFMRYGVEARHLRMYKTAAEREASFFEQVVMPMLKQRNPQARRQASDTLSELSRLGQSLRSAMLRQALRQYLEGS
jgi:DNA-binding transcriptional MerR regulator